MFFLSGSSERNGILPFEATGSDSRAAYGGIPAWDRMPRLSIRSLWILNPVRIAQVPVPVGSQANPTLGCNNSFARLSLKQDLPTVGSLLKIKLVSNI